MTPVRSAASSALIPASPGTGEFGFVGILKGFWTTAPGGYGVGSVGFDVDEQHLLCCWGCVRGARMRLFLVSAGGRLVWFPSPHIMHARGRKHPGFSYPNDLLIVP